MLPQPSPSDTGIRVSVTPAQSAFFAGENFSVTVTFTNTRSTKPNPPVRAESRTHKRTAHSISSAPLARPPTSPITPRTVIPVAPATHGSQRNKSKHERKGLIGLNEDDKPGHLRPAKGKSMSVMLLPEDVADYLSSPSAGSPLRDSSVPLNHPHARKQSVDAQMQVQLNLKELSSSPALLPSGSASTSEFSLALDTISENIPSAFSNPESHSYPPKRRPHHLGLGLGPPPASPPDIQPPRTAFSSAFAQPGTELVLYAYAQLTGSLVLGAVQEESRAQAQVLNAVRGALQRQQAVGGGRMDISSSLDAPAPVRQGSGRKHARATSLSSSLMALLSPPAPAHQPSTPGGRSRPSSLIASLLSPSVSSPAAIGSNNSDAGTKVSSGLPLETVEEVPADTPLPTFDIQPAMLAVDLVLAPGESRSYTYTLPLPANLPPTYRGRMMKFAYHLVVGVCRAAPPSAPNAQGSSNSKGSTSQVMRVPVRVYNHVDISGIQRPYDLLSPVLHSPSKEQIAKVSEVAGGSGPGKKDSLARSSSTSPQSPTSVSGLDPAAELRAYATRLLASLPDPSKDGVQPLAATSLMEERELRAHEGDLTGCHEAVEILTRNMRKVSYDVNKEGVKVAVLTFTKSAYRLGETVVGVAEINERTGRACVLKLSALLESHETLPSSLTPPSAPPKKSRKLHAEYHSALTASTLRTTFTLDIPPDAAPAFQCACASPFVPASPARTGSPDAPGGLVWTVRLCLLVGLTSPHARVGTSGLRVKHLVRDGAVGEWGTAWRATRGIAPLQNIDVRAARRAQQQLKETGAGPRRGWASYLLSGLLEPGEREYHDGDEDDDEDDVDGELGDEARGAGFDETRTVRGPYDPGVDLGGGEEGWAELRVETVECEVPIRVWPGNTAFRPLEVVFDV
ncbi:hypothetical protein M0805_009749 [Coniferiporia weirii]|nr:hypothetical protein M0805_009749 [Coniferiporia weirii]